MNEARPQIGFEQTGLGSILRHNHLVVPPNQREYSWEDRQIGQLFRDFAKAINDGGDYFLGTIVTIPRVNGSLEVVDGQQRLATTALLLAAMRDYLREKNEDFLVESIENEFLTGIDRVRRARIPKLRLNVDDNDLFTDIVANSQFSSSSLEPTRASHQRLQFAAKKAKEYVRTIVASLDPKDHGDVLNRWVSFVEHRALAVLLRVPDDADAYKMFETLNDRGLRTSQADLIKNYLFGRSGERIVEVQAKWAYMRGALESLEDDDVTTVTFLRHALIVTNGFLREVEVYDAVQDIAKSEDTAVTFSTTLESLANAYVATFNPEHTRWNSYPDSTRRAIEVFNLLGIRPMRPLLLAITAQMKENEASTSIQFLLSLGVRLLLASTTRSGSVEQPLAESANMIWNRTIATKRDLRNYLTNITPSNQEFRNAVEDARVSNARLARYYLRSLELAAQGDSEPWFFPANDRSIINLEHVLPRKPASNWPSFNDEEARIYVNRLGNLALMRASDNSSIRSDEYSAKKEVYSESPYELTSSIAAFDEWTPLSIIERQKNMAALAVKAWPVTP